MSECAREKLRYRSHIHINVFNARIFMVCVGFKYSRLLKWYNRKLFMGAY